MSEKMISLDSSSTLFQPYLMTIHIVVVVVL